MSEDMVQTPQKSLSCSINEDFDHSAASFKTAALPGIEELWAETLGDPEIRIAVLDGPVDLSHPCFKGAELEEVPTLVPPGGRSDHGTHVTSLIFGQPGSPVSGIAPRCHGLILPVFSQQAGGSLKPCSQQDLAFNISQAIEKGAHVINVSGGELTASGTASDFLENAVRQAAERNILIVAATGNEGCECLQVPAALPRVLAVGALDLDGQPLGSSNWSEALAGIMAPGALIEGALPGGRVGLMSGTSFAAPLVSGIACLLMSLQKKYGLPVDAGAVRQALLDSVTPCDPRATMECRRLLRGILNVRGACDLVLRPARDHSLELRQSGTPAAFSSSQNVNPSSVTDDKPQLCKGVDMSENIEANVCPQDTASIAPAGDTCEQPAAEVTPACGCTGDPPALVAEVIESPSNAIATVSQPPAAAGGLMPSSSPALASQVPPSHVPVGSIRSAFTPFPSGQKVFVIGKLYYDFGTEARRDYFISQMRVWWESHHHHKPFNQGLVYDPVLMAKFLAALKPDEDVTAPISPYNKKDETNQDLANALIWTLYIDQDPVYALVPEDQYSILSFTRLTNFLLDQAQSKDPETFRIAAAGTLGGTVTLFNGTVVPELQLLARGMYDWDFKALIDSTPSNSASGKGGNSKDSDRDKDKYREFLLRIYELLRNLGVTSEDRAKNFTAANTFQLNQAFSWAVSHKKPWQLDNIYFQRSPICRRNSDCWDVRLIFFDPDNLFQVARMVFEYTIDVSDVIPVQVGEIRRYPIYGSPSA